VADALVIGYGNDLRTDDGAGRWVADRIDEMGIEGVEVRSVSQLTPELALLVAGRDVVVFVDASVDTAVLTVGEVDESSVGAGVMSHHGDPATLLSMAATVGQRPARAYVVSIPASDLGMGLDLTASTRAAAEEAVTRIAALLPRRASAQRRSDPAGGAGHGATSTCAPRVRR
jgi:hydrogenase maturation protease